MPLLNTSIFSLMFGSFPSEGPRQQERNYIEYKEDQLLSIHGLPSCFAVLFLTQSGDPRTLLFW